MGLLCSIDVLRHLGVYVIISILSHLYTLHQMKLITPSGLIERLKINGSLARAALRSLEAVRFYVLYDP